MQDKNYIRQVADKIRAKFDSSEIKSSQLDDLFDIYAVLVLGKGTNVTNEDVHNAWAAWADEHKSSSEYIVPYCDLSKHVQGEDTPFTKAIKEVALDLDKTE